MRDLEGRLIDEVLLPWASPGDDLLSVTLMARIDGPTMLSIGVREADGRVLVEAGRPELSTNRLLRGRGSVVGMIPSATASLPLAPNFRVTVGRLEGDPRADNLTPPAVTAWIKRSGATARVPATQALPMAVFLVGDAADDGRLATALGEAGRIWRAAGIELREPAKVRLPSDAAGGTGGPGDHGRLVIQAALGTDSPALGALFRRGQQGPPDALALFIVRDIVLSGAGTGIWAVSGGIPVPPVAGTARSGIAVSGALLARDPVWAGQVIAHEIGHALGLYHTTEREPMALAGRSREAVHDLLDDTPACPLTADTSPQDGQLTVSECEEHDGANLMFWAGGGGSSRLTPGQAEIARRSALTR